MFKELKEYLTNYSKIKERKLKENKINACQLKVSIDVLKEASINNNFLINQNGIFWIRKDDFILYKWIETIALNTISNEYDAENIALEVHNDLISKPAKITI